MNKRETNEELYLGASLLKTALGEGGGLVEDHYKELLNAPGIDGALYLLYKACYNDDYVANSVKEIDSLWENGPSDEPNLDWRGN